MRSMSDMRRILLVIPISAAVIAGLVALKLNRDYEPAPDETSSSVRLAPLFELLDEQLRKVRLQTYAGRHKLLIVFFDGSRGAQQSALVSRLRERYDDLHATGAVVLAISEARPSQNRYGEKLERLKVDPSDPAGPIEGAASYPFHVLTDILPSGPDYPVHREYGAFDFETQKPLEAVFVVDRGRMIRYTHLGPDDLGTVDDWIQELSDLR